MQEERQRQEQIKEEEARRKEAEQKKKKDEEARAERLRREEEERRRVSCVDLASTVFSVVVFGDLWSCGERFRPLSVRDSVVSDTRLTLDGADV